LITELPQFTQLISGGGKPKIPSWPSISSTIFNVLQKTEIVTGNTQKEMEVSFSYLHHAEYKGSCGNLVGLEREGPLELYSYNRR